MLAKRKQLKKYLLINSPLDKSPFEQLSQHQDIRGVIDLQESLIDILGERTLAGGLYGYCRVYSEYEGWK